MGRKVGSVLLGLMSAVAANSVYALGLGEIKLNSSLDQPLDAEIRLLEVRDLSKSEILINMASSEAFQRQGVERNFFLTDIKYNVVLKGPNAPYVRLSSNRPVREPFLNFILEARWPSGKLLREYTVLLDLPVFSDETTAPVSPVQTQTVTQSAPPARSKQPSSDSTRYNPRSSFDDGRQANAQPSSSYGGVSPSHTGDSYNVAKNDTLWEIALSVRPDSSVSVHQTMMALHRANPEAFIDGNINLLKAGRVLRVPDLEEIQSLNRNRAVREVAQHNSDWSGSSEAAPLDASRADYDTQQTETSGQGRLSLVSPDNSFDASEGRLSGGSDTSSDSAALEQELNVTQESLDKAEGENRELRSKIGSLEDQIKTLESMLEVSSESLRALELSAAENNADEAVDEALLGDESAVGDSLDEGLAQLEEDSLLEDEESLELDELFANLEDDTETVSDDLDELSGAESDELDAIADSEDGVSDSSLDSKEEPVVKSDPSKVVHSAPPAQKSLIDTILEYLPFIGLALLALLAGVWFFFKKKSNEDEDDFDDLLGDSSNFDDVDEDYQSDLDFQESEEDVASFDEDEPEEVHAEAEEDALEPETEDVVAESDIYIAYGKYDQAEEMLQKALASNPHHHEARLKLLEVFAAQGNAESFDPNYAVLRAGNANDSLITRAAALRDTIEGAGEFDESLYNTGEFEAIDAGELPDTDQFEALNLEENTDETPEESVVADVSLDESISELSADDFDLSLDTSDASADIDEDSLDLDLGTPQETDQEGLDSGDIEFDLEGLDFAESTEEQEQEESDVSAGSGIELDIDSSDAQESISTEDLDKVDLDLDGLDELELEIASSNEDLELELGSLDSDIAADLNEFDSEKAPAQEEAAVSDSVEFDLGDLDAVESTSDLDAAEVEDILDLDEGLDSSELDLGEVDEALDLPSLDADSDTTLIRDQVDEEDEAVQELQNDDQFDLSDLDQELSELSSDTSVDVSDALDLVSEVPEVELSEPDVSEPELPDLDSNVSLSDGVAAQAELDATIAEGEDILAGLDDELAELDAFTESKSSAQLEEPDLDFDAVDVELDAGDVSEASELESAPEVPTASTKEGSTSSGSIDFELPDVDPDSDEELDFLADTDETSTKLDLAAAYVDMGDMSGARDIIEEILSEGNDEQKASAEALLKKIDG